MEAGIISKAWKLCGAKGEPEYIFLIKNFQISPKISGTWEAATGFRALGQSQQFSESLPQNKNIRTGNVA